VFSQTDKNEYETFRNLVLRDIILEWDDLVSPNKLENKIDELFVSILAHIEKECLVCDERGPKCAMNCNRGPLKLFKINAHGVEPSARCQACGILGHRKCINFHFLHSHLQDE
jgi:hypothetical protein